jgi:hypothetical protein
MNKWENKHERGQSLVIIALGIIAFVAILALVLDGANAYAAKRQAQNAADAGALAGAQVMCKENDVDAGETTALDYAHTNGADDDPLKTTANGDLTAATMTVHTTITKKTFFAGVIGFLNVAPEAEAVAACKNPGVGVLPVAWSCRATTEEGIIPPGEECKMKLNPDPEHDPYNPNYTYILMDSVKVKKDKLHDPACDPDKVDPLPVECLEDTSDIECYDAYTQAEYDSEHCVVPDDYTGEQIDCDINNDCVDELKTGGARAWLDLNGDPGGGANELIDWITEPDTLPEINVHDWLPSQVSVTTSVFKAATNLVGKDVILPVFNNICTTGEPDIYSPLSGENLIKCINEPQEACTYTQCDNLDKAGSSVNYHIYSFTAFHVTCIQTGKNKNTQVFAEAPGALDPIKGWCQGHYSAWQADSINDNDKTIEGYFINLDTGGYGGPGSWVNTGVFTVVLVK